MERERGRIHQELEGLAEGVAFCQAQLPRSDAWRLPRSSPLPLPRSLSSALPLPLSSDFPRAPNARRVHRAALSLSRPLALPPPLRLHRRRALVAGIRSFVPCFFPVPPCVVRAASSVAPPRGVSPKFKWTGLDAAFSSRLSPTDGAAQTAVGVVWLWKFGSSRAFDGLWRGRRRFGRGRLARRLVGWSSRRGPRPRRSRGPDRRCVADRDRFRAARQGRRDEEKEQDCSIVAQGCRFGRSVARSSG